MAVLSRPSLRSVRREEPTDAPKKQRMERSDRHKSSPDCLDTTVEEPKTRLNLKTQSRSRTRHRASSSSVDVASPAGQLATPATRTNGTGTGTKTARARRNPATPSGKNLFGIHESPDPLDTISPAPSGAQKQRTVTPSITDDVKPLVSPVPRTSRRIDNRVEGKVEGMLNATVTPAPAADHKDADEQTEEKRSGRRSLRSTDTGSRCKSELAQYFHNYEQIISLEEAEPGKLYILLTTYKAHLTPYRVPRSQNNPHTHRRPIQTPPNPKTRPNTLRKPPPKPTRLHQALPPLQSTQHNHRPAKRRHIFPRAPQIRTTRKATPQHRAQPRPTRTTSPRTTPRRAPRP